MKRSGRAGGLGSAQGSARPRPAPRRRPETEPPEPTFEGLGPDEQLAVAEARALDPRTRIATGWGPVDDLLHRGGFGPGELVILGGRTHTRKTTVTLNLIVNMLRAGVPVGFVTLDEAPHSYVFKLMSAMSGRSAEWLEEHWETPRVRKLREQYRELTRSLSITKGYRPSFNRLNAWLELADQGAARPEVVFIDYVSLLARDKYAGAENQRIVRLIEELQVWTNEHELVTVALHQVGRLDEGHNARYHGATPMSLAGLKYGGEEVADIVFGTYRPALDPLGNMERDEARAVLGDKFDEEEWEEARHRVRRYFRSTFLQLLKNRPGTRLEPRGIELLSEGDSMQMRPVEVDEVGARVVDIATGEVLNEEEG